MPMNDELQSLCRRLAKLPSAVISDVLAAMGLPDQVLASTIRSIAPSSRIAGLALCMKGREGAEPASLTGAPKAAYEMDRRVTEGYIVVIDSGGHSMGAVAGDNIGVSLKLRGCKGSSPTAVSATLAFLAPYR